ncbi:cobalt-precorrin-5B (C(1))-methyltransferase CbiD [Puniceicoccus vermicola]|uniref:Cobalt-precorrin-5B C(1)-methyltransferase n=1 Tax=Puniceicoccus vermicola TaxID=388746 RepID=A0A7X1AZJ8_9BACT|nr:cobalt-precorrin-5B (C(1))-methyltransferase [Puniceicoccus vermicola]
MNKNLPTPVLPTTAPGPGLRTGFSTGAYLSATAVAAWLRLEGRAVKDSISILFPDGELRSVNIDGEEPLSANGHAAWAAKDAGEDVDKTHGLIIRSQLQRSTLPLRPEDTRETDFVEVTGSLTVVLRGGKGVGLVTRKGLDVPPGKPAINPTPRKMLLENLSELPHGNWRTVWIEVSIEGGEKVARRTLNPTLGVVGGLSILGTSGQVIPCSHAAYVATIEILIRGAALNHFSEIALVTGGRSHRWLKTQYPDFEDTAIVRFGDFIEQSLAICQRHGIPCIRIVCMAGKLAKYALGITNTHADKAAQSPTRVADLLISEGMESESLQHASDCRSVRELLDGLETENRRQAIQILKSLAAKQLQAWAHPSRIHLHVLDTTGKRELP